MSLAIRSIAHWTAVALLVVISALGLRSAVDAAIAAFVVWLATWLRAT